MVNNECDKMVKIYAFPSGARRHELENNKSYANITPSLIGKSAFLGLICLGFVYLFATKEATKAAYYNGGSRIERRRDGYYAA